MATLNKKTKTPVKDTVRLAGGSGTLAARQDDEAALRRLVMTCLLWEDNAYVDGRTVVDQIKELVPKVNPIKVAEIAVQARYDQKLRHVPLLIVREMARYQTHKYLVADTLCKVINRPDELNEFVSLYWKSNKGKKTLSKQVQKGLAAAFNKFNEYSLAKYNRDKDVKLRDVLFLSHATPKDQEQAELFRKLANNQLAVPDTWEVGLSAARSREEKREVWSRLLREGKLGALAFLKNLRGICDVGVSRTEISRAFDELKPAMLLPIDFLRAAKACPDWTREIESAMFRCLASFPKLPGWTILVVDVSGSMGAGLSGKTDYCRLDAAAMLTMLAAEVCDHVKLYCTAGSDGRRIHQTAKLNPSRGFALAQSVVDSARSLGGGGIFTRQCLEYIKTKEREQPDRIIVFSDSQDCDHPNQRIPNPFGKTNYIIDVSCHRNGINYKGIWDQEISGWSPNFLNYIAQCESEIISLQNC